MDLVARLRSLAVVLLLLLTGGGAFAYGTVAPSTVQCWRLDGYVSCARSPSEAATVYASKQGGTSSDNVGTRSETWKVNSCQVTSDGNAWCTLRVIVSITYKDPEQPSYNGESSTGVGVNRGQTQRSCPENSSEVASGQCECALNFKPEGGQCLRYDCPAKGSYSQQVSPDVKLPNAGDSYCSGGCMVTPSTWKVDQEGQVWGVWPMKSANQACGGKKDAGGVSLGDDQLPEAPVACPANQCPGSVNGTNVCVPCKSATTPGPSTSASGAQPGDPPKDPADPDSAVKGSTSQTTCVGAVCTTVTKYYDGKGNEVGSKTEEQAETDYCQKNPSASQCKKDSFGGACEGGFTCEGDAVECALAKEVHTRNCQWFKEPSQAILDAGDRALSGGILPDGHPYKEAMNAGPTSFSLSNKLDFSDGLGGGCPSDTVVSALGQTLVIPWSQYCVHLQMVGNLAVAVTLLICAFIVFKE